MIYLKSFKLLNEDKENNILDLETRRIYNNQYPLRLFPSRGLENIEFDHITIFCGDNGSGKTTLINMIAQKLKASRLFKVDKGSYFNLYVDNCQYDMADKDPMEIKLITSDDVFDYLLDLRTINNGVNRQKEKLSQEFIEHKFAPYSNFYDNYEELKRSIDAKKQSMSGYVRQKLVNNNIIEQSNGQSALMFWQREIKEDSIYILDEPENSLSAENQLKLRQFIEESVRFYNCQFIISTHSPFLLKLKEAKIYDLDIIPVKTKEFSKLSGVLTYYNFFKEYEDEFK